MTEKRVLKSELIKRVQASSGDKNRDHVGHIVNCFLEEVGAVLAQRDRVELTGFGSFYVRENAERQGRNPRTGEIITINARVVPAFRAGTDLKSRVSEGI